MIAPPDSGQGRKRKGPVSGETDQPGISGISEAPKAYRTANASQGGKPAGARERLRLSAIALGEILPDEWQRIRILTELVKADAEEIARELLAGEAL